MGGSSVARVTSYGDPQLPDDAAPGGYPRRTPSAVEIAASRQQLSRAIGRAAIVNCLVLAAAALQYVFAPFGVDAGLWILVAAAVLCAVNMTWTIMRHQRRSLRSDGGVRGPVSYADLTAPAASTSTGSASVGTSSGSPAAGTPFTPGPGELALDVEDVFSITGRGTVVTGLVAAGTVRVGDHVRILRAGQEVARGGVSGVEMFRRTVQQASAGDTVGLLVAGISRDQVERGDLVTF